MGCHRILLVEDDADLLELMAEIIEQRGTTVVRCSSGAAALDELRQGPRPDLILLDLSLPQISGTELVRMIRRHEAWRAIPVAGISGFPAGHFPNLPVDEFVSKPFDAAELDALISRLCGTAATVA